MQKGQHMSDEQKTSAAVESDKKEENRKFSKLSRNVDEALQSFNQANVEPPKKSKNWVGLVVLPVVIALGLYFMIELVGVIGEADSVWSFSDLIENVNVTYLILIPIAILAVMLFESIKYLIVTHAVTNQFKLLNSIKVGLVGKYYDDITPFSAGGQPMQIFYLHKKGHSGGTASAIILIKYFVQMMCWVTICFLLMVLNRGVLDDPTIMGELYVYGVPIRQVLVIAGWIGWCVNAILPLSIVLFAIFPKITNRILEWCINLVINISWRAANRKESKTGKSQLNRKVKLIRRKRKWIDGANSGVKDFRSSFIVMSHKPLHFISLIAFCTIEQLLTWAFPFVVLLAFDKSQAFSWDLMFAIMTLNVYAAMSVTVVPTPGNSGLMEVVMSAALTKLLAAASVWVLVGWRMSTYYIYIIVGMGIMVFEFIRRLVRNKRMRAHLPPLAEVSKQAPEDNENN